MRQTIDRQHAGDRQATGRQQTGNMNTTGRKETDKATFTYVNETLRQGRQDIFQTWQPPNVTMVQVHTNKF